MNWGKKILFVYLAFVGVMIFMVVKSFQQDYDLVTPDYYAEELKFQDQIDASNNAAQYNDSIEVSAQQSAVVLQFPAQFAGAATGEVYFYKASNSENDVKQALKLDASGEQSFNRSQFATGAYTVKIKWVYNNTNYYTEKDLFL